MRKSNEDPHSSGHRRVRTSTACPVCGTRHAADVWRVLVAKPVGSFSLSGAQVKFSATGGWRYECTKCGATGPAEPKRDHEKNG